MEMFVPVLLLRVVALRTGLARVLRRYLLHKLMVPKRFVAELLLQVIVGPADRYIPALCPDAFRCRADARKVYRERFSVPCFLRKTTFQQYRHCAHSEESLNNKPKTSFYSLFSARQTVATVHFSPRRLLWCDNNRKFFVFTTHYDIYQISWYLYYIPIFLVSQVLYQCFW